MRELYELELLLRVCEDVGAQHLLTGEGEVTSEGVMVARIRASVSAEEIRKMRERRKRRQEDIALDGRWGSGFRPFGYSVEHRPGDRKASYSGHVLVIKEAEAALLCNAAPDHRRGVDREHRARVERRRGDHGDRPPLAGEEPAPDYHRAERRRAANPSWRGDR
ncbi:hypothetical protein [Geodermatophilus obscurus]|uniref:hypothetical protein n=1 Tax=Geodermatophilus obscurus TaxID=1861 RepID=UPI0003265B07|nr:hypothetical protein [Geodermatophilus obscurus]